MARYIELVKYSYKRNLRRESASTYEPERKYYLCFHSNIAKFIGNKYNFLNDRPLDDAEEGK